MIILDATTKSLQFVLGEAATTNDIPFTSSYVDVTTTTFTPIANDGTSNGTTPVTIIAAPAGSTQRKVELISVSNTDTVTHTLIFSYNDNSTLRTLFKCTLNVNETVHFYQTKGWVTTNADGPLKAGAINIIAPSYSLPPNFVDGGGSTGSLFNNVLYAVYLGLAPKASTSINLLFRNTIATTATIAYAEVGIFKGIPTAPFSANINIFGLGYTSIAAVITTAQIQNVNVSLSPGCNAGDLMWAVIGISTTGTVGSLQTYIPEFGDGTNGSVNSKQPSTNLVGVELTSVSTGNAFYFGAYFN